LQELVSQLDAYFAKPDQVSVDGALGIAKEFLKSHSTADLTVTLTTGQTYGIKGSAGEKDVQVGGEVSVTKGTKQVIYSSEGGGEE
jgi:hypothetical protein